MLSVISIVVLLATCTLPVYALDVDMPDNNSARGQVLEVCDSFYFVQDYNGDQHFYDYTYKYITVPTGYRLVDHGTV